MRDGYNFISQQLYKHNDGKVTAGLGGHSPAGAGRALGDAHEEPGGADLLELGLLAGVQQDHGESEVERDPQAVHHLLAQILTEETRQQQ